MYTKCKLCQSEVKLKNETLNLVQCNECDFIFCSTKFSQDDLKKVYDELYNKNVNSHYSRHVIDEYETLKKGKIPSIGLNRKRIVDKFIKKTTNNILEIGSGVGLLGAYLRNRNIQKYTGIELDEETFEKSRELNLNAIHGDFSLMKNLNIEFDIVMLWEVLEHLQDIKSFLNLSHEKLVVGGHLLFSVPNYNKVKNYPSSLIGDNIHQDNPPIHINFFTKNNIPKILEMNGFKIEYLYIKKIPYFSPFSMNFYKMLFKVIFNTYHGSTIFVAAKKV